MRYNNRVLAIMAAGLGSRFGGLKQTWELVDGLMIMDFSIYDALKTSYGKVLLLISEELVPLVADRYEFLIGQKKLDYVVQPKPDVKILKKYFEDDLTVNKLTDILKHREKPLGTGYAVSILLDGLNWEDMVTVINADDYYTAKGFRDRKSVV